MKLASVARLLLGVALFAGIAAPAQALPDFWETYKAHYGLKEGSKLFGASCANCHTQPPRRNDYGKAVEQALKSAGSDKLTGAMLDSIGSQDADGDGFSNAEEIKADTHPADAADKPAGTPQGASDGPGAAATTASEDAPSGEESPFNPKHTFHPLVVHFPIALFLFGAFLEVLGKRRADDRMREFAVWNLGFGALFGVLSALTGIVALLRFGYPFEGLYLYHLIASSTAAVLMVAVAAWRRKQAADSAAYWFTLAVTCVLIAVGGHIGAMLVHG